jgi:hypothetical protein
LAVGSFGLTVTWLSYAGFVGTTVSTPVGWGVGIYGGVRLLQDIICDYKPIGNGVGQCYDPGLGIYIIK